MSTLLLSLYKIGLHKTQKNPKTQKLETMTEISRKRQEESKSREFDWMAKKAGWEDKKIKKTRLKSRDFDWMEKNGGSEARNSSLEILIEREERS
jgi:hypothetical protein